MIAKSSIFIFILISILAAVGADQSTSNQKLQSARNLDGGLIEVGPVGPIGPLGPVVAEEPYVNPICTTVGDGLFCPQYGGSNANPCMCLPTAIFGDPDLEWEADVEAEAESETESENENENESENENENESEAENENESESENENESENET